LDLKLGDDVEVVAGFVAHTGLASRDIVVVPAKIAEDGVL
jgi:hypothetical protein